MYPAVVSAMFTMGTLKMIDGQITMCNLLYPIHVAMAKICRNDRIRLHGLFALKFQERTLGWMSWR